MAEPKKNERWRKFVWEDDDVIVHRADDADAGEAEEVPDEEDDEPDPQAKADIGGEFSSTEEEQEDAVVAAIVRERTIGKGDAPGHPFRGNQYSEGYADAPETSALGRRASKKDTVIFDGKVMHVEEIPGVAKTERFWGDVDIDKLTVDKMAADPKFAPHAEALANDANNLKERYTKEMDAIAGATGGTLIGKEYAAKGKGSIQRKITKCVLKANGEITPSEAAAEQNDTIRYTTMYSDEQYAEGVKKQVRMMSKAGYQLVEMKNTWPGKGQTGPYPSYVGINSVWLSPEPDSRFIEMQFHTNQSFITKQYVNHHYYEISRMPSTDAQTVAKCNRVMRLNAAKVPVPRGAAEIRPGHRMPIRLEWWTQANNRMRFD